MVHASLMRYISNRIPLRFAFRIMAISLKYVCRHSQLYVARQDLSITTVSLAAMINTAHTKVFNYWLHFKEYSEQGSHTMRDPH